MPLAKLCIFMLLKIISIIIVNIIKKLEFTYTVRKKYSKFLKTFRDVKNFIIKTLLKYVSNTNKDIGQIQGLVYNGKGLIAKLRLDIAIIIFSKKYRSN